MAEPLDAVALLKADHCVVEELFASFETASGDGSKQLIAAKYAKSGLRKSELPTMQTTRI